MKPAFVLTEHQIQDVIFDWLSYGGYWVKRNNTGAHAFEHNGKKRIVRYGTKGAGDLIFIIPIMGIPALGYIEVKRWTTKQTESQRDFQIDCERNGIFYCVARSIEDVDCAITEYKRKKTEEYASKR